MSKRGNKDDKKDGENIEDFVAALLQAKIKNMEKPKLVQIIIYESSV